MRVNILEKIMHGRDVFEAGETRVVPDDVGAYFCANGWAEDVDGKVATVPRDPNRVTILEVANVRNPVIVEKVNG